jgi:hypothetical protein
LPVVIKSLFRVAEPHGQHIAEHGEECENATSRRKRVLRKLLFHPGESSILTVDPKKENFRRQLVSSDWDYSEPICDNHRMGINASRFCNILKGPEDQCRDLLQHLKRPPGKEERTHQNRTLVLSVTTKKPTA